MTPELQLLLSGYFCVFAGDPKQCTPHACFASLAEANLKNIEMGKKHPVMAVDQWAKQYLELPEV